VPEESATLFNKSFLFIEKEFVKMGRKVKDLTGMIFHELTVIGVAGKTRSGSITWLCKCSCGNEKTFSSDHLTRKKSPVKSCGCKRIRYGSDHHQWKGCGDISGNWWYNHVLRERRSRRFQLPVTVTVEYAWDLFLRQKKKCALSGLPLVIAASTYGTASIDRIDNSKGYEPDNIQWVHKDINFMKGKYSQEYFVEMCKKVACEIS
jgi:hypothetical protein